MKAKYLLLVLPLLVSLAFGQSSTEGVGGQGGMIFEAGGSARSLAMGQAFTAISDQGEAMLYNPAGLGQIHTTRIGLMGGLLYAGAMQSVVTGNMPLGTFGTVGLTYTGAFASLDDGTILDENGDPISGSAGMNNSAVILSYGKKLKFIGLGLSPKFMLGVLADEDAFGFDADFGAMIYPASFVPSWTYDVVTLGVTVKNLLGATMDYTGNGETPANPRIIRAGLGLRVPGDLVLGDFDISYALVDSAALDWYGGLEFNPLDLISLRAGINKNFLSAGLGLHLDLARTLGMDVDYAFMMPHAVERMLGPVHKVSLNLELRSVAGLYVTVTPVVLTTTEYADILVHGTDVFYGRTQRWSFEILDQLGTVRYRQQREVKDPDRDAFPSEFKWSGLDNIIGGPVKNGWYFYRITITDNLGDQIVYKGKLLKVER
ncbi:hypothetical protein JXM67_06670 [candidate division WOR-3 bacterium]|nr:hypothetical protein [candidate division WOR-3 bacterium]